MKIEKLELNCNGWLRVPHSVEREGFIMMDAEIPLNRKIIKAWVKGMNKIEKESFFKILTEGMTPNENETELREEAEHVLTQLNRITGKKLRPFDGKKQPTQNLKLIMSRLKDGYNKQQCLMVIDIKSRDPFFFQNQKYMNPSTLFRASNFDRYLNEIRTHE